MGSGSNYSQVTPDASVTGNVKRITDGGGCDLSVDAGGLGVQSVTLIVIAGTVTFNTVGVGSGTVVPAGVSLTWSCRDTDDSSFNNMTFGASTPGDAIVNWTTKATPAG